MYLIVHVSKRLNHIGIRRCRLLVLFRSGLTFLRSLNSLPSKVFYSHLSCIYRACFSQLSIEMSIVPSKRLYYSICRLHQISLSTGCLTRCCGSRCVFLLSFGILVKFLCVLCEFTIGSLKSCTPSVYISILILLFPSSTPTAPSFLVFIYGFSIKLKCFCEILIVNSKFTKNFLNCTSAFFGFISQNANRLISEESCSIYRTIHVL